MKESWGLLEHSQALFQAAVAQAGLTQILTFIGDLRLPDLAATNNAKT